MSSALVSLAMGASYIAVGLGAIGSAIGTGIAGATASPKGEERAQRGSRKQKKGEEFLHEAS